MLVHEAPHFLDRTRHQCRRHEAAIVEHHHLFGAVADIGGVIHHQCLVTDAFEHVGGGDIAHVERRILPHQHNIDILAEIEPLLLAAGEVIALDPLHRHREGMGEQAVLLVEREAFDVIFIDRIAARLRAQHQRKGTVACNIDPVDRVHLDRNAQGHSFNSVRVTRKASTHFRCGSACGPVQAGSRRCGCPRRLWHIRGRRLRRLWRRG